MLWQGLGVAKAFNLRWESAQLPANSAQLPADTASWYDRIDRLDDAPPAKWLYKQRCRNLLRHFEPAERFTNVGVGPRHKNSFQVSLAVDSYLDGAPATAMPWTGDDDPVVAVPIHRLFDGIGPAALAVHATHAREIVSTWGEGAKGIISVRDPQHPTHRVFNVIAQDATADGVRFVDYSAVDHRSPQADQQAEHAAMQHLSAIDERSGFPSIRLWRTADLPGFQKISSQTLAGPQPAARAEIDRYLSSEMPASARRETADRILFFRDHNYTRWLLTQINRGACTFDPRQLHQLSCNPAILIPITRLDSILWHLALRSTTTVVGPTVEFSVVDSDEVGPPLSELLAGLGAPGSRRDSLVVRRGRIDGFDSATVGIAAGQRVLDRIGDDAATYAPPLPPPTGPKALPPSRRFSWIDANRPQRTVAAQDEPPVGARKTNCWNTAAAVANYLSTGAPSTSLPIYVAAPLRPTIPAYLSMLGVTDTPTFVHDQPQANAVAAGWGPNSHGIVLAAWSSMSTHVFNVVVDDSGIRYLDGHTAEDGDFNFDVRWERIGIVKVGELHPEFVDVRLECENFEAEVRRGATSECANQVRC